MKPERWKRIESLYHAALEREPAERAAFLREACADEDALRCEIESLLGYEQEAGQFIEVPALEVEAKRMAEGQVESMLGRQFGSYRILSQLGAGGMGEVYLAEDIRLDRKVAIKFIQARSTADEQAQKRLIREAQAAARLEHSNICAIYEVGEQDDVNFIVMQYVEGETLASRIQRKPLQLGETLDLAIKIADALSAAHSHGIIHRDIKPQNIIVGSEGQLKVLDFGLAKAIKQGQLVDGEGETESVLSTPGAIMGTPAYMSPEQARGETLDARSDIFSFGSVLYEMVSGRHPFAEPSPAATLSAILTTEPAPLARYASDVPDELQRIVRKALSKSKEARYQGVKDLLIDLRELKQDLELRSKLERSIGQEGRDRATATERAESGGPAEAQTGPLYTVRTDEVLTARTTSSTRIVIDELKRHKLGVSLTVVALIIGGVAAYFYFNRQPVLTEKDTILLADFVNTTGEPVFDGGTLKQGLAVQLQQSPFLSLFPDERVRQALRLMSRSPDERVTREVGREIALRQGLKAVITGRIAKFDRNYSLTLEAINSQTGETIALTQVETEGKDQVLKALSQAATQLREKLGESLSSIQRFDRPLEQATTSKLEAFQAYALGNGLAASARFMESIPVLERAVEIDPDFATAYSMLSVMHNVTGRPRRAAEYAEKAYALRDRVSEYEKLRITSRYHGFVNGDETKRIEVLILQKRMYPRDWTGPNDLAGVYNRIGKFDQAIAEARESIGLNPNFTPAHRLLGWALLRLNRFTEARDALTQALQQKLDTTTFHYLLYEIAFINNDTAGMQQQLDWASGKPDEYVAFDWQTGAAAFAGQWRRAQAFSRRAIDAASRGDAKEVVARYEAEQALRDAVFRQFAPAKAAAAQSLKLERNQVTLTRAALALALCDESSQTKQLVDELATRYPKDTLAGGLWLPVIRAVLELQRGNAAQAIELLEAARRYEPAAEFWPQYVRGQAYLKLNKGAEAAAEFQRILDHRGEAPLSALYPLAHLGVARAAALTGDVAKSRTEYDEFLTLWGSADLDSSILIEAKKEYEKVK
ncbi:MAG TPA: protein kinase [Blastocatellia bacterium]|jgi:serine/threonine protein kinase/tetratricopeptide (TPR) repeat protein|nr:protein kinase [Blastocatellia bacterium]